MTYTNEITVSTKALKAAKESLGDLIEGTGEIVTLFKMMQQIAEDTGIPLDAQLMNDCEQMFISINRLLYEQDSKLKHLQMMQIAAEKASRTVGELRRKLAGKSGKKQEATLFNQAV